MYFFDIYMGFFEILLHLLAFSFMILFSNFASGKESISQQETAINKLGESNVMN